MPGDPAIEAAADASHSRRFYDCKPIDWRAQHGLQALGLDTSRSYAMRLYADMEAAISAYLAAQPAGRTVESMREEVEQL